MGRSVSERIAALLDEAEASGSCLTPFRRADALALERRLGTSDPLVGGLVSPRRGLYVRAAHWSALKPGARELHVIRGLARAHPEWAFCGTSAALAWGLPVSWHCLRQTQVVCGPRAGRRLGRSIARHELEESELVVVGSLRVTSLERTVLDCLSTMPFADGLAVADAALRLRQISCDELRSRLERSFSGHRGIVRARAACAWADPRAESGGESIARALMIERGVALPALQVELADPLDSSRGFRVDFSWADVHGRPILGELDGRQKYDDPELMDGRSLGRVLVDERRREARLTAYGAKMMRFSLGEVRNERTFWSLVNLYGIPHGEPPELRGEIPVSARVGGWKPGCGAGGLLLPGGEKISYLAVAV